MVAGPPGKVSSSRQAARVLPLSRARMGMRALDFTSNPGVAMGE
jgi:hypothetical protein